MLKNILLIGGYGTFGRRLTRLLSTTDDRYHLILAGRTPAKAINFIQEIKRTYPKLSISSCYFDLNGNISAQLKELCLLKEKTLWAVVNLTGPFQGQDYGLVAAAADLGVHYIDIADGRHFVTGIGAFDEMAKKKNISIISGASSVPALSSAVIDECTLGWEKIEKIEYGITPANRTPRGKAVVGSILSYSGKKIKIFKEGRWQNAFGWGGTFQKPLPKYEKTSQTKVMKGMGRRWFSYCEIPDLDLFVDHYKVKDSVVFYGGMELSFIHLGLSFLCQFVKVGMVKNLSKYTGFFTGFAQKFEAFGTDTGGMFMDILGKDEAGNAKLIQWRLVAGMGKKGSSDGINVPVIATYLMIEKIRKGEAVIGAAPCVSMLKLADFETVFEGFNIKLFKDEISLTAPLFQRELGQDFEKLPKIVKQMHQVNDEVRAVGWAEINRGTNIFADLIAWLFKMPSAGKNIPVKVVFKKITSGAEKPAGEVLRRDFGGQIFTSSFGPHEGAGLMTESFGPFKFLVKCDCHALGIDMTVEKTWLFGQIPLPKFLTPVVEATEREVNGQYQFDVDLKLPLVGRIILYKGLLDIEPEPAHLLPAG